MSKFLAPIDMNKLEVRNRREHQLAAAPSSPVVGQVYYDTVLNQVGTYTGSEWEYFLTSADKAAANGLATLNASLKVVQDPASAATVAAPNAIPKANGSNKIDNNFLNMGTGAGIDVDLLDGQHGSYFLSRANHTGSQLASTISDFDTAVRANSRLDQMAAPTSNINVNNQQITNLADPTNPQDAVTKNYVDTSVQGLDPKASVRAATTETITLSAPQTVDGITLIVGNRVLVKDQGDATQNGIYSVALGAWSRTADADTWAELTSAYVFVQEGASQGDSGWTCTVDAGGAVGNTDITWVQFSQAGTIGGTNVGTGGINVFKQKTGSNLEFRSVAAGSSRVTVVANTPNNTVDIDVSEANILLQSLGGNLTVAKGGTGATTLAAARTNLGAVGKYAASIGDGSALSFTVTHNLSTTDVQVSVFETASPFSLVYADIQVSNTNAISIQFSIAPTANQYRVVVMG